MGKKQDAKDNVNLQESKKLSMLNIERGVSGAGSGTGVATGVGASAEVAVKQPKRINGKKKTFLTSVKKFFSILFKLIQFLVSIAGVLLVIYLILQLRVFSSKLQTILELQKIIGNLKASVPIVQMQLVEAEMQEAQGFFSKEIVKADGLKTFQVSYFNASGDIEDDEPELISIIGKNIYMDCDVYNFSYSLIETGEVQNIAIPYRIYSDIVPPEEGIILNAKNEKNIPFTLLQSNELGSGYFYQLENKRLTKLMEIINNPKSSKELGIIRTRQKAAVANYDTMQLGKIYRVTVENTGGLTFKIK